MSTFSRYLAIVLLCSVSLLSAQSYSIPFLKNAPTIDGRYSDSEWQEAAGYSGFYHRGSSMLLSVRRARWLIGYDEQNLYLCVRTEMPPAGSKLIATVRRHDGKLLYDDSLELWIMDAPAVTSPSYYTVMFNALGTQGDTRFFTSGALPDVTWKNTWKIRNGQDAKRRIWTSELSIPLASLQYRGPLAGQSLRFLLSRNWQRPFFQTPFLMYRDPFTNTSSYPKFVFGESSGSAVQVSGIGELPQRGFKLSGSIYNGKAKTQDYVVKMSWKHSDMPEHQIVKKMKVETGKREKFICQTGPDYIHDNASHKGYLQVLDGQGKLLYEDTYAWKLPVNAVDRWISQAPEATTQIFYHPSSNRLGCRLELFGLADRLKIDVLNREGKNMFSTACGAGKGEVVRTFALPKLTVGTYRVRLAVQSKGTVIKVYEHSFLRDEFPWEKAGIVREDVIYPPFKPMTYEESGLRTVLSSISFNEQGMYSQVKADGRPLLKQGAGLVFKDGQGTVPLACISKGFIARTPGKGIWESKLSGRGFTVRNKVETEYDGCSRFTLTLTPEPGQKPLLKALHLDIPFDSSVIRLFHVISAGVIRANPAIKVPEGQGVIWRSTDVSNGDTFGNMHCYLWLGEMARGLSWFADTDRYMALDEKLPCQELIRQGDRLILRLHFINRELRLTSSRSIVFGMQPSPTKPMPKDWRKPPYPIPPHGGSARYAGGYTGLSKYPAGNDWTFVDEMVKARLTGRLNRTYIDGWLETYFKDYPNFQNIKNHALAGHCGFMIDRPKQPTMIYFEEYGIDQFNPEWITYQDEWNGLDFTQRKWLGLKEVTSSNHAAASSIKIIPVRSYQRYALWYARKWFEHGIGLYFDNVYPKLTYDRFSSQAYLRPDGQIQPSSTIWEMRDYHRRMWLLCRQMQKRIPWPLLISLHTTNCQCIPILTWTDVMLDLEWGWASGTKPFPPELLEIESTGRQIGAYPHAHFPLIGNAVMYPTDPTYMACKPLPETEKTEWAMRMIYEILRINYRGLNFTPYDRMVEAFGYPDRCKIYNYWERNYPVTVSSPTVKSIVLDNGSELMIILASWSDQAQDVEINIHKPLKVQEPKVKVRLEKYGCHIIRKEVVR